MTTQTNGDELRGRSLRRLFETGLATSLICASVGMETESTLHGMLRSPITYGRQR